MEKTGWKIIAIIFIILFILETMFLIWAFNLGEQAEVNESKCVYSICDGFKSYQYDQYSNMCYCFVNGEVIKEKYVD